MCALPSAGEQAGNVRDRLIRRLCLRLVRRWRFLLVLLGLTACAGMLARPHLRAWYHRRAARIELQRCHNFQAARHLLVCRAIWPRDAEALLLAARAARRAQNHGDADRLLGIYLEVRGRDDAHDFELLLLAAERRVDEYAQLCWKYVEEGRFDKPLLMEALTRGHLRQYRLSQARLCVNRWKQVQPNDPQAFYLEGVLNLDYIHAVSGAVQSYRRAVELDADHDEARLGLAVALQTGRHFEEAAEQFERLRLRQLDNVRVQVGLAECRDSLGDIDEAARLVDDVLARQPRLASALSLRGRLAIKNEKWAEAEIFLRRALGGDPHDNRTRYNLVRCLERLGQSEEARQHLRKFQQLEADKARFHDIVNKEIGLRPTDPALYCTLGQILLRNGQYEAGVLWLQSALRLDPRYAPARQALTEYQSRDCKGAGTGSP